MFRLLPLALCALLLAGCSGGADGVGAPVFHEEENPERLSDWGVLKARGGVLQISKSVTPYDIATPLFSDYALKLRTIWMPKKQQAMFSADGVFDMPVGTIITKTFYYRQEGDEWTGIVLQSPEPALEDNALSLNGLRLIETRILVRRQHGWDALPYVWNEDQTDAVLKRTGEIKPLTLVRTDGRAEEFAYLVPNANQCAACHAVNATTKAIEPIGVKFRHLNKRSSFHPETNQINHWIAAGMLAGDFRPAAGVAANVDWTDAQRSLDARARAYLDANCSHCHNPKGAADTSGLNLEPDAIGPAMGFCKTPVAAGGGSGGRQFDIVPGAPENSITLFRMETTDPGAMMPELGRAVTHDEGVALIAEWIAQMEGDCG